MASKPLLPVGTILSMSDNWSARRFTHDAYVQVVYASSKSIKVRLMRMSGGLPIKGSYVSSEHDWYLREDIGDNYLMAWKPDSKGEMAIGKHVFRIYRGKYLKGRDDARATMNVTFVSVAENGYRQEVRARDVTQLRYIISHTPMEWWWGPYWLYRWGKNGSETYIGTLYHDKDEPRRFMWKNPQGKRYRIGDSGRLDDEMGMPIVYPSMWRRTRTWHPEAP